MSLTFWDTVRGVELADTLIRTLPALAKQGKHNENIEEELRGIRKELEEIKNVLIAQKRDTQ